MARSKIEIPKKELRYLYLEENLSPVRLADKFNCSERVIYSRLHEYDIPLRRRRERPDITKEKLEKLYIDEELNISDVAEKVSCTKSTVWMKLKQFDINTRTRSEANSGKYEIQISKRELKSLYLDKKLSTSEIAEKFSCSKNTIVKRLHAYNIPFRGERVSIPRDELKNLYVEEKKTTYEIAKRFDCGPNTVLNRLRDYGISVRESGQLKKEDYEVEISEEELRRLYISKEWSISEVAEKFNCSPATIHKRLNRYDIPVRDLSEAHKGQIPYMKGRHHTPEAKRKIRKATIQQLSSGGMKKKDTSIELALEEELERSKINYEKDVPLCNITVVDFYLPKCKIVIYADGDYWHNLPEVKERDKEQNKILKKNGYKVFRFWGREINKSAKECVNKVKRYIKSESKTL